MIFVRASADDIPTILRIQESVRSRMYQPSTLEGIEKAIRDDVTYLIVSEGSVVGLLIYIRNSDHILLDEFVVERRGQGIGTAALEMMLGEVSGMRVELWTHPENPAAHLYRRHGFVEFERIANYYGDGEPRMHMRREY